MVNLPVLAFGRAAEDNLRGLRRSSERRDVRDTGALDGQEREEECQEDRQQAHANRHLELDG